MKCKILTERAYISVCSPSKFSDQLGDNDNDYIMFLILLLLIYYVFK
jgi:hypothetical protein